MCKAILVLLIGLTGCAEPPAAPPASSPRSNSLPALFPGVSTPGLSVEEQTKQYSTKVARATSQLLKDWVHCLRGNVSSLAVTSNEAAAVIVTAAFASCSQQRQKYEDAFRPFMPSYHALTDGLATIDNTLSDLLGLEIVKLRAATPIAPAKPPALPALPLSKAEPSI